MKRDAPAATAETCAACGKSELNIVHVGPLESRFHPFNETEGQRIKRLLEERDSKPAPAQPAEVAGTLTREEFDETLRHAENAAGVYVAGRSNVNDHRFTLRLLAHDAALRSRVEKLVKALRGFMEKGTGLGGSHPHLSAYVAFPEEVWTAAASALAAHGEAGR